MLAGFKGPKKTRNLPQVVCPTEQLALVPETRGLPLEFTLTESTMQTSFVPRLVVDMEVAAISDWLSAALTQQ